MKKIISTILLSTFLISKLDAITVKGDSAAAADDTFSFDVGPVAFSSTESNGYNLWTTSNESPMPAGAEKYALNFIHQGYEEPVYNLSTGEPFNPKAQPMANNQDATIYTYNAAPARNVTASTVSPNPIYGAKFSKMKIIQNKPIFVLDGSPTDLYAVHDIQHFEAPAIGTDKTELMKHKFGANANIAYLSTFDKQTEGSILVAHTFPGGAGQGGKLSQMIVSESENLDTDPKKIAPALKENLKCDVLIGDAALTGGGIDLTSIGTEVTIHQHDSKKSYMGINATPAAGGTSAAITIVQANSTGTALELQPIAPNAIITQNTILSSNAQIAVRNIASMRTSTSLDYLIFSQNDGAGGNQKIYAAPIVTKKGDDYGKLANVGSIKNNFDAESSTYRSRYFDTVISNATQIQTGGNYNDQLTVGGDSPFTEIKDMYASCDTVFIVIDKDYSANDQPGTFFSQAIFDAEGRIINWTKWSRVLGSDERMNFSCTTPSTSSFYSAESTAKDGTFKKIVQTDWNQNHNLNRFLKAQSSDYGTQNLLDFPKETPALNNASSFMISTGYNNVTISQTGEVAAYFKVKSPVTVISHSEISDSAFVTAELAKNNTDHWLFAGGADGLYVLSQDIAGYLKNSTFNSVDDFKVKTAPPVTSWKKIGDFKFVKKIINDGTSLYVLTPTELYRIALTVDKFKNAPAALAEQTVIKAETAPGAFFFNDMIIDGDLCILGTTNGLFYFNPTGAEVTAPIRVNTPLDMLPSINQLFLISKADTATPKRVENNFKAKSNLYVLSGDFGTEQAALNRFEINTGVITPFNDCFVNDTANPNGIKSSFQIFNQYASNYFTNGSMNLASTYNLEAYQPSVGYHPALLKLTQYSTNGMGIKTHQYFDKYLQISFLTNAYNFIGIKKESTSGALIASGSFEARVNS